MANPLSTMVVSEPAQVLANRYRVDGLLGVGGMAYVFRGFDLNLKRRVAIKVMLPELASSEEFVKRFENEAQSAAQLNSPGIVSIHDWGIDRSRCFIIMELVDGMDLRTVLRHHGALRPAFVAQLMHQVCKALDMAHRNSIIHRDIKPSNIMLTRTGTAKLADFGIAQMSTMPIESGPTIGTRRYMSPEQLRGGHASRQSDIYSLGVTMYELCGGSFEEADETGPCSPKLEGMSDSTSCAQAYNSGFLADEGLKRIISTCIQIDPSERFPSAAVLRAHLEEYLTNEASKDVSGRPSPPEPEYWVLAPPNPVEEPTSFIKVDDVCIVGRDAKADITIPSPEVSDYHALITPQDGFLFVQDLDSEYGTYVNGFPVSRDKAYCLPGDMLSIGPVHLVVGCKR